jgi:type VI secretion system protein ImpM
LHIEGNRVGWFGKLPTLGDFITKRLPDEFVKPWDAWLQAGMLEAKATFPQDWEEHFLTFPFWRFLIDRGTVTHQPWMGLLIPSADRVGRLFPLTIALPLDDTGVTNLDLAQVDLVLDQLQALVNKLLEDDLLEEFEEGLMQIDSFGPSLHALQGVGLADLEQGTGSISFDKPVQIDKLFSSLAVKAIFLKEARALWWVQATETDNGIVRTSPKGLDSTLFVDLVRGVA